MNKKRHFPFPFAHEEKIFLRTFGEAASIRMHENTREFISQQNVQNLTHGLQWQSHNSSNPDEVSELQTLSHETSVESNDILLGRLEIIESVLEDMVNSMKNSFEKGLFKTVSDACDASGNVVAGKSPARSLLEMLQKIEFGVGRDGKVSFPTIYGGTELFNSLKKDKEFLLPDFQAELKKLTEQKVEQAKEAEKVRKSKFRVNT